jgi:tRNA pseudouridine55 synthase
VTQEGLREGFLPVDKPPGPTSHDVVARARKTLGLRKVGHTGTLDPFASGLLLLCVGRATRLTQYLDGLPKSYEAEARLGQLTTTLDTEGEVVREDEAWKELAEARVRGAMAGLTGRQEQIPPAYSAKKLAGEAAYLRARRGEAVVLAPVEVEVHELELLELSPPRLRFRVRCSTGTYVRALARDLGEHLGTGAHLTELRRTAIGPIHVRDAVALDALTAPGGSGLERLSRAWIRPLDALAHLPRVDVTPDAAMRLGRGQAVPRPEGAPADGTLVAVASGDALLAVAEVTDGTLRPRKVFPRD